MEIPYVLQLAFVGAVGAVARSLIENRGSILLWRTWSKGDSKGVDLGILSSVFIGMVVAVVVDQSLFTAFSWAMAGPHFLEELIKARTTDAPGMFRDKKEEDSDGC